MREFEILLLATDLISLLLIIRKSSRRTLLVLAGANISVLVLHWRLDGLRWQMTLSYIFTIVFSLFVLARARDNFPGLKVPKFVKVAIYGMSFAALFLSFFLGYAFPVFTLLPVTGDYQVGIKYFEFVDENRIDPFLNNSSRKRELMVKIHYPGRPDPAKPWSPYFHGSLKLLRAYAEFYHLPNFVFHHLTLVKTHEKEDLAISDKQRSYPVVLFSHGAGTGIEMETSQSEDLASHGYIVVDIDHTYVSAATEFPDHIVTAQQATTNFDTPEPAVPITQIMADDNEFVIRELGELNKGEFDSKFKGRLNLDELGVIGHSVGGAVAYNLAINDARVKAAIDLDGAVYVVPRTIQEIAPFLMVANDQYHTQAIEKRVNLMPKFDTSEEGRRQMREMYGSKAAYDAAYAEAEKYIIGLADVLKTRGTLYTIAGSDHMKFTDIGLYIGSRWVRELMQIRGSTDPARCLQISDAVTLAFFDQHLKGEATTVRSLAGKYPELRRVALN